MSFNIFNPFNNLPRANDGTPVSKANLDGAWQDNISSVLSDFFFFMRRSSVGGGGGLTADCYGDQSITNVHTNLTMDSVKQGGNVDTANASFELPVVINSFPVIIPKPNCKIHITWGGRAIPLSNTIISGNPASRNLFIVDVSSSLSFSPLLFSAAISQNNTNVANNTPEKDVWQGLTCSKSDVFNIPTAGTYYFRLKGGHSGNYQQQSRLVESFITYIMN